MTHAPPARTLEDLPQPEPSAGIDAYRRERELRLETSPECRANYERYLQARRTSADVDYLPVKLDIENVSRCNFRCTMCVVSTWDKGRRAEDMSLDAFKQLIDEQTGLVEIKLNGLGEALMQGDDYFEMIRYARERHIWVRITTNASLLHLRDNHRKLIDSGVNEIDISIDGADKQTFENIRQGSRFEYVTRNCKLLNDYCREKGVKRTKMWSLIQRDNVHHMPDLVDLAAELGFHYNVFSLSLHGWGHEDELLGNNDKIVEDQLDPEFLFGLIERGERLGIATRFWRVNEKFSTKSRDTLCPWPFERAVVTSDLRTVPCCMIGDPEAYEIGKGSGKSFGQLWTDQHYRDFRQAHLDGDLPDVCKGCYQ